MVKHEATMTSEVDYHHHAHRRRFEHHHSHEAPTCLKTLGREFYQEATIHGLDNATSSRGLIKKTFWAVTMLGMLAGLTFNITMLTILYISNPISYSISVTSNTRLNFPAITICNLSPIKKTQWLQSLTNTSTASTTEERRRKKRAVKKENNNMSVSLNEDIRNRKHSDGDRSTKIDPATTVATIEILKKGDGNRSAKISEPTTTAASVRKIRRKRAAQLTTEASPGTAQTFTCTSSTPKDVGIDLSFRQCAVFEVLACPSSSSNYAAVYLSTTSGVYTTNCYTVILNGPSSSSLQSSANVNIQKNGAYVVSMTYTDIVSCTTTKWFWITWVNGVITLGSGSQIQVSPLIVYHDKAPITVNFMAVSSFSGTGTTTWTIPGQFYTSSSAYCTFSTPINGSAEVCAYPGNANVVKTCTQKEFYYMDTGIDLTGRNWLVFQVQSASDVNLALGTTAFLTASSPTPSYELGMDGTWNAPSIPYVFASAKNGNTQVSGSSPGGTFSSTSYEWMWVSWLNGTVAAGLGTMINENTLTMYTDTTTSTTGTLTHLGISSALGITSSWIFSGCYYPPPSHTPPKVTTTTHKTATTTTTVLTTTTSTSTLTTTTTTTPSATKTRSTTIATSPTTTATTTTTTTTTSTTTTTGTTTTTTTTTTPTTTGQTTTTTETTTTTRASTTTTTVQTTITRTTTTRAASTTTTTIPATTTSITTTVPTTTTTTTGSTAQTAITTRTTATITASTTTTTTAAPTTVASTTTTAAATTTPKSPTSTATKSTTAATPSTSTTPAQITTTTTVSPTTTMSATTTAPITTTTTPAPVITTSAASTTTTTVTPTTTNITTAPIALSNTTAITSTWSPTTTPSTLTAITTVSTTAATATILTSTGSTTATEPITISTTTSQTTTITSTAPITTTTTTSKTPITIPTQAIISEFTIQKTTALPTASISNSAPITTTVPTTTTETSTTLSAAATVGTTIVPTFLTATVQASTTFEAPQLLTTAVETTGILATTINMPTAVLTTTTEASVGLQSSLLVNNVSESSVFPPASDVTVMHPSSQAKITGPISATPIQPATTTNDATSPATTNQPSATESASVTEFLNTGTRTDSGTTAYAVTNIPLMPTLSVTPYQGNTIVVGDTTTFSAATAQTSAIGPTFVALTTNLQPAASLSIVDKTTMNVVSAPGTDVTNMMTSQHSASLVTAASPRNFSMLQAAFTLQTSATIVGLTASNNLYATHLNSMRIETTTLIASATVLNGSSAEMRCCCQCCTQAGQNQACKSCSSSNLTGAEVCASAIQVSAPDVQDVTPQSVTTCCGTSNFEAAGPLAGSEYPQRLAYTAQFENDQIFTEHLASLPQEEQISLGYTLNDIVFQCMYDGVPCNLDRDFVQFYDLVYGNCYIYNSGWNTSTPVLTATQTDRRYGLTMTLNINQDEYDNNSGTDMAGIRLAILDQNIMPFPEDDGITISPGYATSIGIYQTALSRLPAPYGQCTDSNSPTLNAYSGKYAVEYSVSACSKTCYQKQVIEQCRCFDAYYPATGVAFGNVVVPVCSITNITQDDCKYIVSQLYSINQLNCSCPDRCNENLFDYDWSLAAWPSAPAQVSLSAAHNGMTATQIAENLIKLQIFYASLDTEIIQEVPAFPFELLFIDLSAILGVWFGCVLVTFFEFFEFCVDACIILFPRCIDYCRRRPPKEQLHS